MAVRRSNCSSDLQDVGRNFGRRTAPIVSKWVRTAEKSHGGERPGGNCSRALLFLRVVSPKTLFGRQADAALRSDHVYAEFSLKGGRRLPSNKSSAPGLPPVIAGGDAVIEDARINNAGIVRVDSDH